MFPYFKKYVIICCAIAVAVPVVGSTVYAAVTGTIMAASLGGLIMLLVLLFGSMYIAQSYFGRKADAETEAMLAKYNDDCDPQAFTQDAARIIDNIQPPYNVMASWFLTYYAQALLDEGNASQARAIEENMLKSAEGAKNDSIRLGILMNAVPLVTKTQGAQAALDLVNKALALLPNVQQAPGANDPAAFLNNQKALLEATIAGDTATLRTMYGKVREDAALPMRIRVESAWKEAQACHSAGDTAQERACLDFVVSNGNKLALVAPARKQLTALA